MISESRSTIAPQPPAPEARRAPITLEGLNPIWLKNLEAQQRARIDRFKVFHDFSFSDQFKESGIRFRHRITDDSGRSYRAVHYDHGNGVVIADVDNDGLYDIYFTTQVGRSELWRNLGNGRFEDITDRVGVAGPRDQIGVSASFADIDNDGDPDLYAIYIRDGNLLFENQGDGTFKDISQASGVDYQGHSSGRSFLITTVTACSTFFSSMSDNIQVTKLSKWGKITESITRMSVLKMVLPGI